jgi:hypothetical protein
VAEALWTAERGADEPRRRSHDCNQFNREALLRAEMNEAPKRDVPKIVPLLFYFGMLFGALTLLTGVGGWKDPAIVGMLLEIGWFFPCGLGLLLPPGSGAAGVGLMVVSYLSFIVFFVAFRRSRTWLRLGVLCFGFAVLLLLNVAGCRNAGSELGRSLSMLTPDIS